MASFRHAKSVFNFYIRTRLKNTITNRILFSDCAELIHTLIKCWWEWKEKLPSALIQQHQSLDRGSWDPEVRHIDADRNTLCTCIGPFWLLSVFTTCDINTGCVCVNVWLTAAPRPPVICRPKSAKAGVKSGPLEIALESTTRDGSLFWFIWETHNIQNTLSHTQKTNSRGSTDPLTIVPVG